MDRRARIPLVLAGLLGLAGALSAFGGETSLPEDRPGAAPDPVALVSTTPTAVRDDPALPAAGPVDHDGGDPETPGSADRHLVRSWRAPLAGGLLTFPPSFHSEDGRYDLVLHLNGNTDLVEESYGYAGLNAVVVILNLGVGSGVYEDRFADPAAFSLILERAQKVMVERGLRGAHLGRVALAGWSSGYGGVVTLLGHPAVFDRVDAVVLLDAIHCGVDPWTKELKPWQIEPTRRFAQKAVEGRALLSITHSEIQTYGYLDAHRTTDAVLSFVGVPRAASAGGQPMPVLSSMVGVLPRALMVPLAPLTEAHRGGLHVRGYDGNGPVTHMLHLVQMSTTALPDLVARWSTMGGPEGSPR